MNMPKKIEIIPASDPHMLKEQLEKMVNDGWEIKGFVYCNTKISSNESFAVLEQLSDEVSKSQQFESEKTLDEHTPQTPRKDIAKLGES